MLSESETLISPHAAFIMNIYPLDTDTEPKKMQLLSLLTASCPPPPSATRKNPACQRPEKAHRRARHVDRNPRVSDRLACNHGTLCSAVSFGVVYHLYDRSDLARNPIPSLLTFRSRRPCLHFQRTGPRFGPSQVTGEKVRCETLVPRGQTEDSLHATVGMYVVAYW